MAEEAPKITSPELLKPEVDVADQHAEVTAQLDRVANIGNEAIQQKAVEAAVELLDVDNLQTVDDEGVTNNFQILGVLPQLHEIDPEAAEEKITELAVAEPYIDNQEFVRELQETVAEVRTEEPLVELPKIQRDLARADALVEIHSQRDTHYPAE